MDPAPAPIPAARHRLAVLAILWVCSLAVLIAFHSVVLPFAGAALIAYLVAPLVDRITALKLKGRTLPRWVAILCIYALFFLSVYLAFIALVPQLYREVARVSRDAAAAFTPARIQQLANEADRWLAERGIPVELSKRAIEGTDANESQTGSFSLSLDLEVMIRDSVTKATAALKENLGNIVTFSRNVIGSLVGGVFMVFFMLMVAAFLSIDWVTIRRYCRTLVPPEYAGDALFLIKKIDRSLAGVVRGQFLICLINGTLTLIGLMIFGVKFAFLLATVATLLSLIPIFGSILSSLPIVLIGVSQSWKTGLSALIWIIGIHALEAYFLNPKIMGSAAKIHPVVVAFALIAGERTWGLVGALFAVPVAAIFVALFDYLRLKAQPPAQLLTEAAKPQA
ncbi:MAG: AI-2E family transporter [Myxococcaceae bacterium]